MTISPSNTLVSYAIHLDRALRSFYPLPDLAALDVEILQLLNDADQPPHYTALRMYINPNIFQPKLLRSIRTLINHKLIAARSEGQHTTYNITTQGRLLLAQFDAHLTAFVKR